MKASPKLAFIACLSGPMLLLSAQASLAGSATWNLNPGSSDWNTATNWTPVIVPNGAADTATFALSNTTGVSISANTEVNGIVFNAGASAFTITASPTFTLTISGVGITNNSGIRQNFVENAVHFVGAVHGAVLFTNSSTAGSLTAFTNDGGTIGGFQGNGGGAIDFLNTSTAGNSTLTNNGGTVSGALGGFVFFGDASTAGNVTCTNNGGTVSGAVGGDTQFGTTATAGNGTFINNGGTVSGGGGGLTDFQNTSTAGNATLIANGGLGGGNGGLIIFYADSTGGTARVEVFGNGTLDISHNNASSMTIGSIEGSGLVNLGPKNLTVGSNNLNTTFSGVIGPNGSLTKVGAGILTFEGGASNDHIADTTSLSIVSGSIVNLNFSGNPDKIGGLIVDGVAQPTGLYGSAASGAPNQLPEFAGTGAVVVGPVIISVTSATGRTGSPFAFQVITIGGTSAARVSATGLPPGLTIDPITGEISGTVTTNGSFSVILTATENGLTNTGTLQLTFTSDLAVPVITSPISALVFPGQPFSYTIIAPTSDSSDPVTYSEIGLLPPGLGLDSATGIISGTPQVRPSLLPTPQLAGGVITNVQIVACNSSGCAAQGLFFLLPTGAANISTRLSVGTDDNVLIGGFITQGNAPMKLVVRGIGPSLPVAGVLTDPYLELHNGPSTIAGNDNWKDNLAGGSQEVAIENTTLAPENDVESAILAVLDPGGYTAILSGTNNGTGVGLVEIYNLGAASLDVSGAAHLANISTRGKVQAGDNVMIGGFINQGSVPIQVLVRGIGPSLASQGVTGVLANPVLELHEPDGTVITNDDWMATQEADILKTTLAPTNALESAILVTLPVGEGAYTAIVRGANNTTGVALVEAYFGNPCLVDSCPPP